MPAAMFCTKAFPTCGRKQRREQGSRSKPLVWLRLLRKATNKIACVKKDLFGGRESADGFCPFAEETR